MLIRFTRKVLSFSSQQKVAYSFVASRKRAVRSATQAIPQTQQTDPATLANAAVILASLMQNNNSFSSLIANNAAGLKNATNQVAQSQTSQPKKRVAIKPEKKSVGARYKTRSLTINDFRPLEQIDNSDYPKKPMSTYLRFMNETRTRLKEENQDITQDEIKAKIKQLWENRDEATKERLNKTYEE